jgi:very-short-patch-repair endonuclease
MIVVEVDGPIHYRRRALDAERTHWLEERGYTVLRFPNEQIERRLEEVLHTIAQACGIQHSTDDET